VLNIGKRRNIDSHPPLLSILNNIPTIVIREGSFITD
jgi:hypothetical protein